jgi:transmembrane sensor
MGQLNDEIDRTAAAWAVKIAGGTLSPGEKLRFEAWRDMDIRHAGAFARAQAIMVRLERLRAVGAGALRTTIEEYPAVAPADAAETQVPEVDAPVAMPPVATVHPRPLARRRLIGAAVASLAAAGLVGAFLVPSRSQQEFATGLGETREVTLSDGSVVTLNTNSRIAVAYSEKVRKIRLLQGEAIFQVAKNKQRPFIVSAHEADVRAVGTKFTVQVLPERPVRIVVQEGVIEIVRRDKPRAVPVRATAETQTIVASSAPTMVHPIAHPVVARELAWQYGRIAFENEKLSDAAEEFARYSDTKIVVDPSVSSLTITGLFAANDPVGFARVAASVLDLKVEEGPKEVRIVR